MDLREDAALLALVEKHLDDTTLVRREDTTTTTARARAVLAALEPYLARREDQRLAGVARSILADDGGVVEVRRHEGYGPELVVDTRSGITEDVARFVETLRP